MGIRNGSSTHVDYDVEEPNPAKADPLLQVVDTVATAVAALALVNCLVGGPAWPVVVGLAAAVTALYTSIRPLTRTEAGTRVRKSLKPDEYDPIELKAGQWAIFYATGTTPPIELHKSVTVKVDGQTIKLLQTTPLTGDPVFSTQLE